MALPSTVLAVYKGVNVSVRLPPWTLQLPEAVVRLDHSVSIQL